MRVLIVSFVFPPHNVIGAVRVGKISKYLTRFGHDVRVIAARDLEFATTLKLEIPSDRITYTPWTDVDAPFRAAVRLKHRARRWLAREPRSIAEIHHSAEITSEGPQSAKRTFGWRARLLYIDLVHFPDSAVGWRKPAVRAGRELLREWRPDVILASGAPWTSLVVARDLARESGVPWVADLRDLWSDNHTTFVSPWRMRAFDSRYEQRILRTASALVTVSEPLAERLRARYPGKPIAVVMNGFDAEDYRSNGSAPIRTRASSGPGDTGDECVLRMVYTGEINRNMLPLLDALVLLGDDLQSVRVRIVGHANRDVRERYEGLAHRRGVADRLEWVPSVPHAAAATIQQQADILLLFIHPTRHDSGVFTGKLFEYVGARRPILVVGSQSGVAAELVCSRGLGVAEADPPMIAERIRGWLQEKRVAGRVNGPLGTAVDDLSREAQTRIYAEVLQRVVNR